MKNGGRHESRPPVQGEDRDSQLTTLISTRTATLAAAYGTRTDVLAVTV